MADSLNPDQALMPGQEIRSNNDRALLIMQNDGNLVVYEVHRGQNIAVWASNTSGVARAVMQGDGNLVVYTPSNEPIWDSGTWGNPGAYLIVQDDGNAVVYASDGRALWASDTARPSGKTGFTPTIHGFRFPNSFDNKVATIPGFGTVETQGRCGGMAYASLDYYYAGIPIPRYTEAMFSPSRVPPDGHWLADYIYARLMNSFFVPSARKFPEWTIHADHETWFFKGVTKWTKEEEFPKLRASIDGGTPAALGLVGATHLVDMGNRNHQVVAYAYDYHPVAQTITVYIYDNNWPGEEVILTSEPGNPHFNASRGGDTWRGFFVHDYGQANPPVFTTAPASDDAQVTFGATIKMSHLWTGRTLHSHPLNYGHSGSSGQQQVTAFEGADDNDLWRAKGPHGEPDNHKAGQPVLHGDVLRLQHMLTGRNLHSHSGHPSPVTEQQEVTCFGEDGVGDGNDDWRLEVDGGGEWAAGRRVRLIHQTTNHALHSHRGHSHPQWTAGQQEVTGFAGRDDNDWWWLLEARVTSRAVFVSQSVPASMVMGGKYQVSVTMRNGSTESWSPQGSQYYALGSQSPQDNKVWGVNRVKVPSSVPAGAEARFDFEVTAPSTPGVYDFQWRMVHELVEWFGEHTPKVGVSVTRPPTAVPNVREMDVASAAEEIRAADLVPRFTGTTSAPGAWVWRQSPSPGAVVDPGSTVTCQLRTGSTP